MTGPRLVTGPEHDLARLEILDGWTLQRAHGYLLTPDDLDDLPLGRPLGEIPVADAPLGVRNVATKIHENWVWRVCSGEGLAIRQAFGPERGDGTRPKLSVLEPCDTISIRARADDPVFPCNSHHVVIVWTRVHRTGKRSPEGAWAWTCEPHPEGAGRRAWQRAPRQVGVTSAAALLAGPPDDGELGLAYAAAGAPVDGPADTAVST